MSDIKTKKILIMIKHSNIYDIDGNLIRSAEQGSFSIDETEKLVDSLYEKIKHAESDEASEQEKEHLYMYRIYLDNANKWLIHLYEKMPPSERMKRLSNVFKNRVDNANKEATDSEKETLNAISEAMDNLKSEYEKENTPTIMDEYVEPIEEIHEEHTENICALHSGESETNTKGSAE